MGTVASRSMAFRDAHHLLSTSASLNLTKARSSESLSDEATIHSEEGHYYRKKSTSTSCLVPSKSCSNLYAKHHYAGNNLFFEATVRPASRQRPSKRNTKMKEAKGATKKGSSDNASPKYPLNSNSQERRNHTERRSDEDSSSLGSSGRSIGCFCEESDCSSASLASGGSCSICLEEFDPKQHSKRNEEHEETIYCTLGSLCSRRSQATVRSRKVKGKRWKNRPKLNLEETSSSLPPLPTSTPEFSTTIAFGFGRQGKSFHENTDNADDLSIHVSAFDDIVDGPFKSFLTLSNKIGGDVASQGRMVSEALRAQREFLVIVSKSKLPAQTDLQKLLKPTSDKINEIQTFRESNRRSEFFNHLSAISESIPALGWVTVSPAPSPFVKEMNDAGQFYANRVLKDWKEKDKTHVEWTKAWSQALADLQAYVKQYHTTGLVWNAKGGNAMSLSGTGGGAPSGPAGGPPLPPPPPPPGLFDDIKKDDGNAANTARNALFDEINRGGEVTKGLKKVTADMQTHKNPTLRSNADKPIPGKKPTGLGKPASVNAPPVTKPPKFELDGKKWIVEYFKNNPNIEIEQTETNQSVYVFRCEGSTIKVGGKCNNIILDGCKKTAIVFDNVVSSCEFINCQSVQMQVLGKVPTISVDKTDGCQMFLSKESMDTEIITAKSTEMNVMIPNGDDFVEQPVPEQFKTKIQGTKLTTTISESV